MLEMGDVSTEDIYLIDNESNIWRDYNNFFDYHFAEAMELNDSTWKEELISKYDIKEVSGQEILLDKIEQQREEIDRLKERIDYLETQNIDPNQIQMDL